jgi:hypothetical protein
MLNERALLVALAFIAGSLIAGDASALLLENNAENGDDLVFFYPYPTSFRYIDPGYAFDDDPLTAFVHEPYAMPIVVRHAPVRRVLVQPRTSFVHEMYRSTEVL